MNQLCKVCGEPAAGYHFGAFTCEGCKSFFGRTYNNLGALGECKNNGQCVINKKNRTSCKSCRLKKCLMVGMSKSGSRYGRRSNWFKIHCLIQDQAEMTNRLAEQGVISNNGQLAHAFNENKDLLSQYKQQQSESFRETSSASSAHRMSPRGASPNSSDGSVGGALSSPYSSIFDTTKGNNGCYGSTRYGSTSPSYSDPIITRKEVNNLNSHFGLHATALPLSPVSPLSPLNAAASRFFFHNSHASQVHSLFGKSVNGMAANNISKLYNGDNINYASYQSRFIPIHALNPVLKSTKKESSDSISGECYADVPEQDRPIDLSLKRANALLTGGATSKTHSKLTKHSHVDHDSGFSPSSNEENNNTSPLDLTSKRTPEPSTGEENEEPSDCEQQSSEHHSQLKSSDNK